MKKSFSMWIFSLYIIFLFIAALAPINSLSTHIDDVFIIQIRLDYLLHSIVFIPWAVIYLLAFHPIKWDEILLMIGAGVLTAFATEGIQYFLTYRSYNINDMIANWMGVILGMGVLIWRVGVLRWSEQVSEGAKE